MSSEAQSKIGSYVIIPNKQDAAKVAGVIKEIDNALMMIAAKKDYIKDAKKALKEEYEMTPKSIQTMIQLFHKGNATEHFTEQNELSDLYDELFPSKNVEESGDVDE